MIRTRDGRSPRPFIHLTLLALPLFVAVIAGCAAASEQSSRAAPSGVSAPVASTTTGAVDEDFVAQASDFGNIKDMTAVRGFFIDNRLGHLDRALAVANDPDGGVYPVGTIVQRFPQEAMVKRKAGFAPDVGDWEFLVLSVSPTGTEITNRGTREIKNILDKSCASCHLQADARYDLVCEKTHGCDPLGVPDEFFTRLQDSDPRPRRRL